jgi:hypothetical protein
MPTQRRQQRLTHWAGGRPPHQFGRHPEPGAVINPRHRLQLGPVGQVEAADHIHLIELQGRGRGSHPNQVDRSRRSVVRDEGWHADLTQQLSDPDLAPRREGQRGRLQGPRPRPPPCSRLLAAGRRLGSAVGDGQGWVTTRSRRRRSTSMHCPRPIGRISTHSSGYHKERTGDLTPYSHRSCQCRQVAHNFGSHRSENTVWGWCWPRLIDKVLTRHVGPGEMVRQLVTYGSNGVGDFFVPKHARCPAEIPGRA